MKPSLDRAAVYLTLASAVSILFSVAISQSLMGLALAALLVSRRPLKFPPVKLPLALFAGGTLISLAFAPDPALGLGDLRKFYLFAMLLLVMSLIRERRHMRVLWLGWTAAATLSALVGLWQFGAKWAGARAAGQDFYAYYIGERITGLMSHWQTFGGEMMIVWLGVASFILFAPHTWRRLLGWLAIAGILAVAIVLGYTRNIWLGSAAGGIYLLWHWRRWTVALVPVAVLALVVVGPASFRTRVDSVFQPQGELDSNQHRIVCWRTGIAMIEAHPLLGLGPGGVANYFYDYVPADIPRPLPEGYYGHLHNIYLQYAANLGIPTALCLFWMLAVMMLELARAAKRAPPETRFFLLASVAVVIAISVAGLFEFNLGDSEVMTLFLGVLGAGYAIKDWHQPVVD